MKQIILLNHNENTKQVEAEEKARFLRSLLLQMFDNTEAAEKVEFIWPEETVLTTEQKMELRQLLAIYNLHVIDTPETMEVYLEKEKIASMYKPAYKMKTDLSQPDKKKQVYLEMTVESFSVFDQEE